MNRFYNIVCASIVYISISSGFPTTNEDSPVQDKTNVSSQYYTREDWDALPANGTHALATPVPWVVVHHTYIPAACFNFDDCAKSMRSMQKYHDSLGWGDIGYNFCIGSDGATYEGRGWNVTGIHAGPANSVSIGICLIGDWRKEVPPPSQLEATKTLISSGIKLGAIRPDYKLIGHNQSMATECPGSALFNEISSWSHFSKDGFKQ